MSVRGATQPGATTGPSPWAGPAVAHCAACRCRRWWRCGTTTNARWSDPRICRRCARPAPSSPGPHPRPRTPSRASGSSTSSVPGGTAPNSDWTSVDSRTDTTSHSTERSSKATLGIAGEDGTGSQNSSVGSPTSSVQVVLSQRVTFLEESSDHTSLHSCRNFRCRRRSWATRRPAANPAIPLPWTAATRSHSSAATASW